MSNSFNIPIDMSRSMQRNMQECTMSYKKILAYLMHYNRDNLSADDKELLMNLEASIAHHKGFNRTLKEWTDKRQSRTYIENQEPILTTDEIDCIIKGIADD